jgi:hypothetical protein
MIFPSPKIYQVLGLFLSFGCHGTFEGFYGTFGVLMERSMLRIKRSIHVPMH